MVAHHVIGGARQHDGLAVAGYLGAGYLWNSGTSCFAPATCSTSTRKSATRPACCATEAVARGGRDLGFIMVEAEAFASGNPASIGYAVTETTGLAAVVPLDCAWSDVGSWHAVRKLSDKAGDGNAARGAAVFKNSRNYSVTTDRALVAPEGVDDLVVVLTQDAVLVSSQTTQTA